MSTLHLCLMLMYCIEQHITSLLPVLNSVFLSVGFKVEGWLYHLLFMIAFQFHFLSLVSLLIPFLYLLPRIIVSIIDGLTDWHSISVMLLCLENVVEDASANLQTQPLSSDHALSQGRYTFTFSVFLIVSLSKDLLSKLKRFYDEKQDKI